ncbi:MAG: DUF4147 domain-containing protein [Thaumarchaeota archaeon]|nr:DUF4147 domain-containing protein [Nitrososphaerota archaeon]
MISNGYKQFIKNYFELATNKNKKLVLDILIHGLNSSNPLSTMSRIINNNKIMFRNHSVVLSNFDNLYTIAIGKAADAMTMSINNIIRIKKGVIIIPKNTKSIIYHKKFKIINSGHPLPNKNSISAARYVIKFLQARKKNEFIIFLISGGGSALLANPDKITLEDKIKTTEILLESGMTIHDVNLIRKYISKIKGGKLLEYVNCNWITLVISDVVGDKLNTISSGYTYYKKENNLKAWKILCKYNLLEKLPNNVINKIQSDIFKIETINANQNFKNHIILNNYDCLVAMSKYAQKFGIDVTILNNINENVEKIATKIVKLIPNKQKSCIIFGGETTVNISNSDYGVGGRNQELVLRILKKCKDKKQNLIIASINTDGVDGNTKYAGAILENKPIRDNEIDKYLKNHNSSLFFKKYNGLINTGPTHTNLADFGIIFQS